MSTTFYMTTGEIIDEYEMTQKSLAPFDDRTPASAGALLVLQSILEEVDSPANPVLPPDLAAVNVERFLSNLT